MRYIPLNDLISQIFVDDDGKKHRKRLSKAFTTLKGKPKAERQGYIDRNGTSKWSPVKEQMTAKLGNKCWYTEVELVGADLSIDHYRPRSHYWWLAFEVSNYRIACPFANSPKENRESGLTGGKADF